ncbi:MAG: hypothetical protein JXR76_30425 [Deltaproteobacteria bacterium]|nr:hypothetical protein [Deltaproteobacteria bacterium]
MNTCEYAGEEFAERRSHPWVDAKGNAACRYYDLTAEPERIRTSLEDFRPYDQFGAIDQFYQMLLSINRPSSAIESNDCAFTGPAINGHPSFPASLQCNGRVMILLRNIELNTIEGNVQWLSNQLHRHLCVIDTTFQLGIIGTTIVPVRYLALPKINNQQLGSQLMISFWAFGNSTEETMKNLSRLFKNLSSALNDISILLTKMG